MNHLSRVSFVVLAALALAAAGCSKNVPPDTPPSPAGPENGRVGYPAQFKVTATDPDFDAVSVRVDWDDGDTSDWSTAFQSDDTMTFEHVWHVAGDFRVSAQARDAGEKVSAWGNWHAILIADTVNLPPGLPDAPAGADTGLVDTVYAFVVRAGDPNGDRLTLQVDWGDGDTSEWSALVAESTGVTMDHSWGEVGDYYLRARARDERGLVGDWSAAHQLIVADSLR
jgi:hypothetical protein